MVEREIINTNLLKGHIKKLVIAEMKTELKKIEKFWKHVNELNDRLRILESRNIEDFWKIMNEFNDRLRILETRIDELTKTVKEMKK